MGNQAAGAVIPIGGRQVRITQQLGEGSGGVPACVARATPSPCPWGACGAALFCIQRVARPAAC
jgi:hypothetical protein